MKGYFWKLKWLLLGSTIICIMNAVLNAAMLLLPGWLIDGYHKGWDYIGSLLLIYMFLFVAYLVNAYLGNRAGDYRRLLFDRMIKKDFFNAVIQRDFKDFHQYDIGEYISMQNNDISEMCMNYMNPIFCIVEAIVMIVIFGISLIWFVNFYIAALVIIFSVAIVLVPQITAKALARRNGDYLNSLGKYTSSVNTFYTAHSILDRQGRKKVTELHEEELNHVIGLFMRFRKLNSFALVLNGGSVELLSIIVFGAVAFMLWKGKITLGMATIAFTYSTKFMEPIYLLNTEIGIVLSVKQIKQKILTIIGGSKSDNQEASDIRSISTTRLEKNYDGAKIRIPSTQLEYPKKYLIFGQNGAGKSVFFRLLMHFEEVDDGQIFYNGQEAVAGIAESVCYVPQTPVIFDASYEENITLYHTYVADKLQEYETLFPTSIIKHIKNNSDPANLSGGEKQVIAILRALCSEKPILLLDEPFAAMNQITIDSFMKKMCDIKRAIVVIAHNVEDYENYFDEKIEIKR